MSCIVINGILSKLESKNLGQNTAGGRWNVIKQKIDQIDYREYAYEKVLL